MAVELYDEHEQSERVRQWIKEYTSTIILGVVLAFAGIYGFRYWQDYRAGQLVLGSEYYQAVEALILDEDLESAAVEYQAMMDAVGKSSYAGLAGLRMAAALVEDGQLGKAAQIYRDVLDNRRLKVLRPLVTLRLARVVDAQGDHAEALALLGQAAPEGYEAAWAEARGDLLFERGRVTEALDQWNDALARRQADGRSVSLLEMKIDAATASGGASS